MLHERIYLDDNDRNVYIDTYVANDRKYLRDAILVIPGGGYSQVCTDREGEPIALAFVAKGMNAFVLNYRVTAGGEVHPYPAQLIDASRAIVYIKRHASELGIDPERVFTVGFSAGGHLCGSLAILHSDERVLAELGISKGENKPRAAILSYPVVSAFAHGTHHGSFEKLAALPFDDISEEKKRELSLECNVNEDSAPLFIWHTTEDAVVSAIGSLRLAESYIKAGRPVALRLYPYGCHGTALANEITRGEYPESVQPMVEEWIEVTREWMKTV